MSGKAPILFLAGGKGTRLQALEPNRPKPMILVKGKPFLHWLTLHYVRLGYDRFVISTGHMAEVIESYPWKTEFPKATFEYHRETSPLGTGGATASVFKAHHLEDAWVVNADTLLPLPLPEVPDGLEVFYTALKEAEVFDAKANMGVRDGRVVDMAAGGTEQYFDAGAVYIKKTAINRYSGPVRCSLHELLQVSMDKKLVGYQVMPGTCYDIGTPKRFRRFEKYLDQVEK